MNFTLKIWRQKNAEAKGGMVSYEVSGISSDSSFFEMLDILNQQLIESGGDPVSFDHDCREGICGTCSLYINGRPHGPVKGVTTCQLHMRSFRDGETIHIEPWRAKAFPVIRDLIVDRSAFDKVIQAGGYVSVNSGGVPDANTIPVEKSKSDAAFDAAACIGCGACVAACSNAAAMLFIGAKVSHLALLPQGRIETEKRVQKMVACMDQLGFGNCSNTYACEAECPKGISVVNIARMNRGFLKAKLMSDKEKEIRDSM
ncbi:succinate dehydrogenase/fumarate reductase iron-sulfur subunit [Chlorobium sp. BLA1]|uniref:succinate dehydrogenase/fumarate reductase iron-sulfur subunit n=1 Tax=Candidatus Chlorobium masyuteum TaxID=2716876 RepID=UPI00141DDC86|nr:succinate dehydrogenase/fumarate reductase iron-sulfur subunit [Candidatus Chlorobium masyuteum]NHQ59683.1 succinate dehydrogenase/fumarate reductase iron-sulfur subunit [Candidatus Chlorobium masyuteum]NTU45032.1 succinate dehydrogenase/fumarate reductase iron-sulfur subunit [Chlorobiaceae bacterium]